MGNKIYSFLCGIYVRIDYALRAVRQINKPHIGQKVLYKDEPCVITNGVCHPKWNIMPVTPENLARPRRVIYEHVEENEFSVTGLARHWRAFKFHYQFWMSYWYRIDVGKLSNAR